MPQTGNTRKVDKQDEAYSCEGMQFRDKKKRKNIDGSYDHCAKKICRREHEQYCSTYIAFWKRKRTSLWCKIRKEALWGGGVVTEIDGEGTKSNPLPHLPQPPRLPHPHGGAEVKFSILLGAWLIREHIHALKHSQCTQEICALHHRHILHQKKKLQTDIEPSLVRC